MLSEIDVVWSKRYVRPVEVIRKVPHANAEAALKAAKQACLKHPGFWFGREAGDPRFAAFLVYHHGKVVERHYVDAQSGRNDS